MKTFFKKSSVFFGLTKKRKQGKAPAIEQIDKWKEIILEFYKEIAELNKPKLKESQYIYDFLNANSIFNRNHMRLTMIDDLDGNLTNENKELPQEQPSPKSIMHELEHVPNQFNLQHLDEKIEILNKKAELSINEISKNELKRMTLCLQNRKKWEEFKTYYTNFPLTNTENIEKLINKYAHLTVKESDIFIPEFPDDAIKVMEEYIKTTMDLCNLKPVFYVISKREDFGEKYKKRDPILIVQSPFGLFWNILGAWDEEMILLTEL